jgi:hypothetical protein
MQKHIVSNPNATIFTSPNEKVISAIKEDTMCLQAIVCLERNRRQEVKLTMTNFYLAICFPHHQYTEYLYVAEL